MAVCLVLFVLASTEARWSGEEKTKTHLYISTWLLAVTTAHVPALVEQNNGSWLSHSLRAFIIRRDLFLFRIPGVPKAQSKKQYPKNHTWIKLAEKGTFLPCKS